MDTTALSHYLLGDIRDWNGRVLAGLVEDISDPDRDDSPGADVLRRMRNGVVEVVERLMSDLDMADNAIRYNDLIDWDAYPLTDAIQSWREGCEPFELAESGPSCYTHEVWSQFVDLTAYNVDISDREIDGDNLTETVATAALYEVCRQLIDSLLDEITERLDNLEYDTEEDDES